MQYNTVVSAGMKMLNALEALPPDARGADALRREGLVASCCACSTRSCRTRRGCCGSDLGFAAELGDLLDAPWPEVDAAALVQDEIELVLQVNGKLRGKLVRAGERRTTPRSRPPRARAPRSRSTPTARR